MLRTDSYRFMIIFREFLLIEALNQPSNIITICLTEAF